MQTPNFKQDYLNKIRNLIQRSDNNEEKYAQAMSLAVGDNFDVMGYIEAQLLKQEGLKPDHTVIDVGCGSGRLATNLLTELDRGKYIGLDI